MSLETKNNNKPFPFPPLDRVVALLSNEVRCAELLDLLKPEPGKDSATYFATLIMFKILLLESEALVAAGRHDLIQKIYVGLYKDLPTITSSVSQGVAESYMAAHPEETMIYVANCGTGGWKLSFIERTEKGIENTGNQEFEKGDDATSLNQLLVPGVDYGVKKTLYPADVLASMFISNIKSYENAPRTKKRAAMMADLETELKNVSPDQQEALRATSLAEIDAAVARVSLNSVAAVPLVVLVTGTIRNYAHKNPEHAPAINNEINKVFQFVREAGYYVVPHSEADCRILMTQLEEGAAEQRAVASLNRAVDSRANVVSTTGIGKGTCQWLLSRADGSFENLDADVGMDRWRESSVIFQQFQERLKDPVFLADHIKMLEAIPDHIVFAFKSGFLIPLHPKFEKGTPDDKLPRGAKAKKLLMAA